MTNVDPEIFRPEKKRSAADFALWRRKILYTECHRRRIEIEKLKRQHSTKAIIFGPPPRTLGGTTGMLATANPNFNIRKPNLDHFPI